MFAGAIVFVGLQEQRLQPDAPRKAPQHAADASVAGDRGRIEGGVGRQPGIDHAQEVEVLLEPRRVADHVVHSDCDGAGPGPGVKEADRDLGADAFVDAGDEKRFELGQRRRADEGAREVLRVEAGPMRPRAVDIAGAEDRNRRDRGDDGFLQDFGVRRALEAQRAMQLVIVEPIGIRQQLELVEYFGGVIHRSHLPTVRG